MFLSSFSAKGGGELGGLDYYVCGDRAEGRGGVGRFPPGEVGRAAAGT